MGRYWNLNSLGILVFAVFFVSACKNEKKKDTAVSAVADMVAEQRSGIKFIAKPAEQKIEVHSEGTLFTSYVYDGKTPKPILYPIRTKSGKTVTRGFPYDPKPNERVDHPHHVGYWFNYGDVNGLDFWNNSYAIAEDKKHLYGTIHHQEIVSHNDAKGELIIRAIWKSPEGEELLEEQTIFRFSEVGDTRLIDRETTLKALQKVDFKDNKEGMVAIRMARALELPSDKPAVYTDAQGVATTVKATNNDGVTGDYTSSEGLTGGAVWGTRNSWVKLEGTMEGETVSVSIFDHKNNVGYPTYWHARDYGLFAANPLGQAVFSEGKEELNFSLPKNESVTFKYRVAVHNGSELSKAQLGDLFAKFQ